MAAVLLSLVVALLALRPASCGKMQGVIMGADSWVYVGRFCMHPAKEEDHYGRMQATFTYPEDTYQQLLMYYLGSEESGNIDDEFGSWQMVYGSDLTCEDRVTQARYKNNVHALNDMVAERRFLMDGRAYREVSIERRMQTNRARWFFVSVGACQPNCGKCVGSGEGSAVGLW